ARAVSGRIERQFEGTPAAARRGPALPGHGRALPLHRWRHEDGPQGAGDHGKRLGPGRQVSDREPGQVSGPPEGEGRAAGDRLDPEGGYRRETLRYGSRCEACGVRLKPGFQPRAPRTAPRTGYLPSFMRLACRTPSLMTP